MWTARTTVTQKEVSREPSAGGEAEQPGGGGINKRLGEAVGHRSELVFRKPESPAGPGSHQRTRRAGRNQPPRESPQIDPPEEN